MEDLEFNKNLKKVITAQERKRQKAYLQSIENTIEKRKSIKLNWWIAASITVLIGFSGYFVFSNQSISNEELYSEYFTPYRNTVVPIVRNDTKPTKKIIAFEKYETGKYNEAIVLLDQLTIKDSIDNNTLYFYKANAYLQLEKPQEAINCLLKISDNDPKWQEERLWYLSLASLKIDAIEDTKKYLTYLKANNSKGFKSKKIDRLLENLD